MKELVNRTSIIILLTFASNQANSKCNVEKGSLDNGSIFYAHGKEVIYKNADLEWGILVALVRIFVIQSPTDKDLLQFLMRIDVGKSGSKKMVVPRKISIVFMDYSGIDLMAESMKAPTKSGEIYFEHSTFRLHTDSYLKIMKNSIKTITIIDSRENRELTCQPYKDILLEQANCIGAELE